MSGQKVANWINLISQIEELPKLVSGKTRAQSRLGFKQRQNPHKFGDVFFKTFM